jgi:peptidoglycan/LPS O-acetylase OafA/YrhL
MRARQPSRDVLGTMEFARGVAILMAVVYHALQAWYANFGWQAIHVFVPVSGFVLTFSAARKGDAGEWGRWIRKRMRRILPAYWAMVVSGFAVLLLLGAVGLNDPAVTLGGATRDFILDIFVLRNFSYVSMMAYPNAALWFVPLIAGLYLMFPLLYGPVTRARGAAGLVGVVLVAFLVEAASRALAIRFLDGMPVGYGQGFLAPFGPTPAPLDRIPNDGFVFQLWAPFGNFPTRIGCFVLGMAGAVAYMRDPERFSRRMTGPGAAALGLVLWAAGNWLVYAGHAGWVAADFVLTAAWVFMLPPLAVAFARWLKPMHRVTEFLGRWSFHLFLTHLVVMYVYVRLLPFWISSLVVSALMLPVVLLGIAAATWALKKFDDSALAERIMPRPAARYGGSR